MKQYKKRTISLVLASVITVAGSFAAENYKNSLMGLAFKLNPNGSVNMTVQTKTNYDGKVSLIRRDATTYMMLLPEFDSQAQTPDLSQVSSQIESISVKTLPYTKNGNGYTRITVKTFEDAVLTADKAVYLPAGNAQKLITTQDTRENEAGIEDNAPDAEEVVEHKDIPEKNDAYEHYSKEPEHHENNYREYPKENTSHRETPASTAASADMPQAGNVQDFTVESTRPQEQGDPTEAFLLVLGIFFVLGVSVYLFLKAKNKLAEIAGEQISIDVDEPKENKKAKKDTKNSRKIKSTIKNLDTKYKNPVSIPKNTEYTQPAAPVVEEEKEELNIVDLDELFQEQAKAKTEAPEIDEDENQALEDFLSGFSFDEEAYNEEIQEETGKYDEELYEETIHNDNLTFDNNDTEKINQLLNTEISDATLKDVEKFAKTIPVKKIPTKQEILEDLVTTYAVSQNIIFTREDINALYKLINVEIDPDFVTDLKTNPERAKEMQAEIEKQREKPHKASEILTLNVKDMLPDLSEALRKQGGRRIESEVKPVTVYYSEGYEFATLSLKDALPDLSKEVNNEDAYKFKPSEKIEYADTSYQVDKLNISNQLPDLADVMKNPEKYEDPKPEPVVVDEDALLKNISNVQFKPFYDGSEQFEVINEFDDSNTPSVSDIQKEFSQFGNFEISNQDDDITTTAPNDYDDFEALYRNEFVDLDKQTSGGKQDNTKPAENTLDELKSILNNNDSDDILEEIAIEETPTAADNIKNQNPAKPEIKKPQKSELPEALARKLEQDRAERMARRTRIMMKKKELSSSESQQEPQKEVTCMLDGESYTILSSADFAGNMGCYLAKNENGYTIIGHVGNKLLKIKQYPVLKSEKIQARVSENLPDGGLRYIVRIGIHKFIVNVHKDNLEYVMDLF